LRQLIRKNLIFLVDKFQIFLLQKIFLEKWCATKRISSRLRPFDCQKSLANVICGKLLDETFGLAFISWSNLSKKAIFLKSVA
jgi:hypothetical protein